MALNNAVALNNLAYGLAVHQKDLVSALPLTSKTVFLAPADPTVLDTLGWIEHLRGDDQAASKLLTAAVRREPGTADIRLHAAIVYGATGSRPQNCSLGKR